MKFEAYYPLMNKEIYLEKFIIEEYEKINKKKEMKILILLLIINIIKFVLRNINKFQILWLKNS